VPGFFVCADDCFEENIAALASGCFFNRACLSRGRARLVARTWSSLLCGSRFFTQSGAVMLARCRHGSGGQESLAHGRDRLPVAAVSFGFILDPRPHFNGA